MIPIKLGKPMKIQVAGIQVKHSIPIVGIQVSQQPVPPMGFKTVVPSLPWQYIEGMVYSHEGSAIAELQANLNQFLTGKLPEYTSLGIDGKYGSKTEQAYISALGFLHPLPPEAAEVHPKVTLYTWNKIRVLLGLPEVTSSGIPTQLPFGYFFVKPPQVCPSDSEQSPPPPGFAELLGTMYCKQKEAPPNGAFQQRILDCEAAGGTWDYTADLCTYPTKPKEPLKISWIPFAVAGAGALLLTIIIVAIMRGRKPTPEVTY